MLLFKGQSWFFWVVLTIAALPSPVGVQSTGTSGSINGTVVDPSNAVVSNATVEIRNPVSGFYRAMMTDGSGKFSIPNVPFNPYHLTVAHPCSTTHDLRLACQRSIHAGFV